MVRGAIEFTMLFLLLCIQVNLDSNRCIREISESEILPLLQATPHSLFQQPNARSHVARIVQLFFKERRVSLHRLPAHVHQIRRSLNMSGIFWASNLFAWSSSNHSWSFVDSYKNWLEENSSGTYSGPLWFRAMTLTGSDCIAWRFHTILKSQVHRHIVL